MEQKTRRPDLSLNSTREEIFSELYSFYWKDMFRFAYFYLKNREEAEDAVQETVLRAYEGFNGLKNPDAFKSWIFTILLRCCKHRLRGIIFQRNQVELDDIHEPETEDYPLTIAVLKDEIDHLSDRERSMIWLSVTAGYKSREIAQIMRLPNGTVRSTLSRALARLKTQLNDNT